MSQTRRVFIGSLLGAAVKGEEVAAPEGDTAVNLVDDGHGGFVVAVRTRIRADHVLVSLFYREQWGSADMPQEALRYAESVAPVAGWTWAATHQAFSVPRDRIQFIRLTFLNEVGKREIRINARATKQ
jgi:hypothetical protein